MKQITHFNSIKKYVMCMLLMTPLSLNGQPTIYNDNVTLITGIWNVNCTISEVSNQQPYEGANHYQIDYTGIDFWAGIGLNMNHWGNAASLDFSGYNAIRIAYRGLGQNHNFRLALRDSNGIGNEVTIGNDSESYQVIEISMFELTAGTSINLSDIVEINLSMGADVADFSGTVFFDSIELFNGEESGGSAATLKTWSRFAKMDRGVNFANWLEAHWLIEFNAFPEISKYNRIQVQSLIDQGFNTVRLPVTFERIANPNPPYTIPVNSVAWDLIDSCIVWAEQMDFSMIITDHHGYPLTNSNYTIEIERIQSIWTQVLNRYGGIDPERFYFELFNEPVDISSSNLHAVYDSAIYTVRQSGAEHSLIVGGNFYNSLGGLTASVPYADSNIIYTIHSYDPYFFTHQGMSWTTPPNFPALPFPNSSTDSMDVSNIIQGARQWSDLHSVPVMLGEFGVSASADLSSRCNYVNAVAKACYEYDIPWYYWDAISNENAFGFIDGQNVESCFESALRLGDQNDCALMTMNKENEGVGSLRDQILCASPGDTIRFNASLAGDTIVLSTLPLVISKNIFLKNENAEPIYLASATLSPVIYLAEEQESGIENISLIGTVPNIVVNEGVFTLKDMEIKKATIEALDFGVGVLIIDGNVGVK